MAVTSHVYPNAVLKMQGNVTTNVNLATDSFTAALCTGDASAWTATQWAFVFASSLTGAYTEISTVGTYTAGYAGRVAVGSPTFTQQAAGNANIVSWTCTSPISFGGGSATISARSMFINDKTANSATTDANSWAIAIVDFGATVSSTSGAYTYTVASTPNGLAYFTCS